MRRVLCVILATLGFSKAVLLPDPADVFSEHGNDVVPRNVTPDCLSHTLHWLDELQRGVPWALNMMDSATKVPTGIVIGSNNHLGNFDQCLAVSVNDEVGTFQGQYCRAWIDIDTPGQVITTPGMVYAFCVPSSCPPEEMQELMQNYIAPALEISMIFGGVNPLDCYMKEPPAPLSTGALICVTLAGLLTGIVVITALVEWRLADKTPPLVRACSLISTCRSLFNTRKHPADISCLHGLRIASMLWIILGHRYGHERGLPMTNPNLFETYFNDPLKMTVANSMPSVDTFFLLSGLLMCTSFLREVHRRETFDVIKFYVYRYMRLAIPIGCMILFNSTILPLIGTGPLWNTYTYYEARNCKANWWTNMIFVNNYIFKEGTGLCLGQTWYTAIDMQLSWLSPLVLIPLYHSPRAGLQLMTLLILISCFIPFAVTYIFRLPMSAVQVPSNETPLGNFSYQIYNATQSRATPYLCGMLFAFYLFKMKDKKVKMSKYSVYLGWTCSTVVALTVIYSLTIPHQPGYVYDVVGSAFYAGFHRLAWSAVLIWIIFACVNNHGGVADKILSWNLLLPLSRLTYSAFLVHFVVMIYDAGSTRTVSHYSDYDAVHDFFGDLLPTYLMSFYMYVIIEGPVLALLRIAFSKGAQSNKKGEKIQKKDKNNASSDKPEQSDKNS